MTIENTEVIIIKDDRQRKAVVEFMLENNITFQSGFDSSYQAREIAEELEYQESNEASWMNSGC